MATNVYQLKSAAAGRRTDALCGRVDAVLQAPPEIVKMEFSELLTYHRMLDDLIKACVQENVGRFYLDLVETRVKPIKAAAKARLTWLNRDIGAAPLVANPMQQAR